MPALAHKIVPHYATRMEWMPVDQLIVDPRFQRALNAGRAERMAAEFDPDALGKPLVAVLKDGQPYIIDGQHRIYAVKLALGANQMIECEVIRGVSPAEAARLFLLRNKGFTTSALDNYLAGLTAGEAEVVAIAGILAEFKLKVTRNGMVRCASALRKVYRGFRPDGAHPLVLRRTIAALQEAWGDTPDTYHGLLVEGLGLFVVRYHDGIDFTVLARKLSGVPPLRLLGDSRENTRVLGGSVPRGVARVVLNLYNVGRTKNRLREWDAKDEADA